MKRTIAILLVAFFITTVTSIAVSALQDNRNSAWGPITTGNYITAYNTEFPLGSAAGTADGTSDGANDAKTGLAPIDTQTAKHHHSATGIIVPQTLGKIDGWNDGIDSTYSAAYDTAYSKVQAIPTGTPGGYGTGSAPGRPKSAPGNVQKKL